MKRYLLKYIDENIRSIIIFSFLILIGIVVGLISYNFLGDQNKVNMLNTIKSTLDLSKKSDFEGISVLKNGISFNFLLIAVVFLSSLTIIAPIILSVINFLKGFSIGLYTAIIFSIFGVTNGMLVTFLLVLLPSIIYLPIFIYIGVNAINFNFEVTKNEQSGYLKCIVKQGYQLLISSAFIIVSIIIEQSLSPVIFSIYSKM